MRPNVGKCLCSRALALFPTKVFTGNANHFPSHHPAYAAFPSAHPLRGVDDELRWRAISMRVCTTCFAPSGPRELTGTLPSFSAGIVPFRAPIALDVEPDGLLRPRSGPRLASCFAHPGHLLGASGARRCGSAPWSLRMSSTRPRAPAAAATRAPRGLRASCLRTATERAPPLERQPSRACPPESAGVRAGA